MDNKLKLIIIAAMTFIIAIGVFLLNMHINNINGNEIVKKMQGVIISKETGELIEHVTISIDGHMEKGENQSIFKGELNFSNINHSKGSDGYFVFSKGYGIDGQIERGIISYIRNIKIQGKIVPNYAYINWVDTDLNFSYLILSNYELDCIDYSIEDSKRVYNGTDIMVFPAQDAKDALELIEKYKSDDIFKITSPDDAGN